MKIKSFLWLPLRKMSFFSSSPSERRMAVAHLTVTRCSWQPDELFLLRVDLIGAEVMVCGWKKHRGLLSWVKWLNRP